MFCDNQPALAWYFFFFLPEPYIVSDSDGDPVVEWWIEELKLQETDRKLLLSGSELSDLLVNASQRLLQKQFPRVSGFQSTLLGQRPKDIKFKSFSKGVKSVQILNTGTLLCKVNVYIRVIFHRKLPLDLCFFEWLQLHKYPRQLGIKEILRPCSCPDCVAICK